MLIVSGTISVEPDDVDAALALVAPLVEATNAEPGCHAYGFFLDPTTPGRFRLFEEWDDQAALDAHFVTDHMAAFNAGIGALRITGLELHKYEVHAKAPL